MGVRSRRYVIVGDGAAGVTAARTLRQGDAQAQITIVSDDPSPAYFRAALTNYLLGELREEQIWATTPGFYEQYQLHRMQGRAVQLDAARAEVHLSHGGVPLGYDALLIASGARARPPSFEGRHLQGVMTLRTLQDCRGVMELVLGNQVRHSVVVGGGPLALEWALGMHARGVKVTVLLRGTTFMAGALDGVASDLLAARLRQAGVQVVLKDEIAEAVDRGDGRVGQVRTKGGQVWQCDLVAAAIGVIPNSEWLKSTGIGLGQRGAVLVNERMQTSLPNVYAAGDVAEFQGQALQLWEPAQAQAKVAARNMSGIAEVYAPGVHYMATRLFDLDFASLGEVSASAGAQELSDLPSGTGQISYRKLVIRGEQLVGALLFGQRETKVRQRGRLYKRLIDARWNIGSIQHQLLNPDFDLNAWLDQNALLQATSAAANRQVAAGAQIKGTSVLDMSQLSLPGTKKKAKEAARPAGTAVLGAADGLGGFAVVAPSGAASPKPDVRAATAALGTQVLSQFNARPAVAQQATQAQVAVARPAILSLGEQRWTLSADLVRVGRDPNGEIVLQDAAVGFTHAHLQSAAGDWYLRDLGSQGGTWVNRKPLSVPKRLETGDRVQLGNTELLFFFADEESALQSAAATQVSEGVPQPRFEVRSGHGLGLTFALSRSPLVIGSDPGCGIWLQDPRVAEQHAQAEQHSSQWYLLVRVPGVLYNGQWLASGQHVPLREGDRVRLGDVELRYTQTPVADVAAARTQAAPQVSTTSRARMQAFQAVAPTGPVPVAPDGSPTPGKGGA